MSSIDCTMIERRKVVRYTEGRPSLPATQMPKHIGENMEFRNSQKWANPCTKEGHQTLKTFVAGFQEMLFDFDLQLYKNQLRTVKECL